MTSRNATPRPRCWRCGHAFPARRARVEAVLHTRAADAGGPYRTVRCAECGTENGVLENHAGRVLLYPLEGLGEPTVIDRIVPRQSREAARAAVAWWACHADAVQRFRSERGSVPPPRQPTGAQAERPRRGKRTAARGADTRRRAHDGQQPDAESAPRAETAEAAPASFETRAPHELLGISGDADAATIRSAYRAALKLCHPDRVANLDPEIQALATAKSKALRRAYETLLRRAGAD